MLFTCAQLCCCCYCCCCSCFCCCRSIGPVNVLQARSATNNHDSHHIDGPSGFHSGQYLCRQQTHIINRQIKFKFNASCSLRSIQQKAAYFCATHTKYLDNLFRMNVRTWFFRLLFIPLHREHISISIRKHHKHHKHHNHVRRVLICLSMPKTVRHMHNVIDNFCIVVLTGVYFTSNILVIVVFVEFFGVRSPPSAFVLDLHVMLIIIVQPMTDKARPTNISTQWIVRRVITVQLNCFFCW